MACISCWNNKCPLAGSFSNEGDDDCPEYISEEEICKHPN